MRAGGLDSTVWLGPGAYLALALVHAGARMGRKTHVVDLGRGDERTRYVAVANSVICGSLLMVVGSKPCWLRSVPRGLTSVWPVRACLGCCGLPAPRAPR